jgi:hypothetical protein
MKRFAPATVRNREPILAVLARVFHAPGEIVEIASGSGEHAVWFGAHLSHLIWQPSDVDEDARASIDAWRREAAASNVRAAIAIDTSTDTWPVERADGVVCINMIHIAPFAATIGLFRGASRLLAPGCAIVLYGPYKVAGAHTAESNERFDAELRAKNPAWGVRDLEDVVACARDFDVETTIAMPANNLSIILRKK